MSNNIISVKYLLNISTFCLLNTFLWAQQTYFNKRYNYGDVIWSVIETDSGYSCLAGSNGILILNIDFNGNFQWEKFYGMPQTVLYAGGPGSLIKTNDDNYVFAGSIEDIVNPNVMLWKYNSTGDTLWTRQYGDTAWQAGIQCKQTPDNGFIVIGRTSTTDYPDGDFWLIKTDSAGNMEWDKTYGGQYYEFGLSVDVCDDGGYILAGSTTSFGPNAGPFSGNATNKYIVKVDSTGTEQWNVVIGDTFTDCIWNIEQTMDKGYIIGGCVTINSFWIDGVVLSKPNLIKLDSAGNIEWNRTYGTFRFNTGLFMVRELPDGSFMSAGQVTDSMGSHAMGLVLKVAANGDSIWYRTHEILSGNDSWNKYRDIRPTSDGGFIAAGWLKPDPPDTGGQDLWVVKMDSCGCLVPYCDTLCSGPPPDTTGVEEFKPDSYRVQSLKFKVYPNPTKGKFNMEIFNEPAAEKSYQINIYDILGRNITHIKTGAKQFEVDISKHPAGVYLIQVWSENNYYNTRVVKY